jgi:hypothetical protein
VRGGGIFDMTGGIIGGNSASQGGGIGGGGVYTNGTFTMSDEAKISGNTSSSDSGGGVWVNGGTFYMTGGEISGNTAPNSARVCVTPNGTFTMSGGTISGNTARYNCGGVGLDGIFNMSGGTISGNTASDGGGGVFLSDATAIFTMTGGTISGNNARLGGGVFVNSGRTFRIVTGTVYGLNEGANSNTASQGAALYSSGTAQRGTFSGANGAWVSAGTLSTTDNTIRVVNGVSQ